MRSNGRLYSAHATKITAALGLLAGTLSPHYSAYAQTTAPGTEQSIIVPPAPPTGSISITGKELTGEYLQTFLNSTASSLGSNLQGLEQNLNDLSQLGTDDTKKRLNAFGTTYGNLPTLGSNLASALSNMNVKSLMENASNISDQLPKLLSDFTDAEIDLAKTGPSQDDIKAAMNSENPGKSLSEMVKSGAISPQFQAAQTNLFHMVIKLMLVNNAVCALNSNIESVKNTYTNLLNLANQPPSVLVSMKNLGPQISAIDSLSISQFGGLSQLGDKLGFVNAQLDALHKAGGLKSLGDPKAPTIGTLGQFDDQLEKLYSMISDTNNEMGRTLGSSGNARFIIQFDTSDLKEIGAKASNGAAKAADTKAAATSDAVASTKAAIEKNASDNAAATDKTSNK